MVKQNKFIWQLVIFSILKKLVWVVLIFATSAIAQKENKYIRNGNDNYGSQRQMHAVTCADCGKETEFTRRSDDNAESLKTRLMAYYKQTSPLIGYYYAKEMLSTVNGLGAIDAVQSEITTVLDA